ncbi:MAG TPA: glycine cleavage system aminomethyltransferase GcvT [Thermoplasmata archaeon]|nr:glycine cleavage system aminomethyltransferase GcvT [Thermoplasmata archaeon]
MVIKSPLHEIHEKLGATFTEFAGHKMPLYYTSIKDEHFTVRKTVGLFDVSHMSNVLIRGKDAEKLLTLTTLEDASRIGEYMGQYTAILREDATIIDDTIFLHLPGKYMVIPNAGRGEVVTEWLNNKAKELMLDAEVVNVSWDYVILAIQGPKSKETLQKLTDFDLSSLKLFGCTINEVEGVECIISRTGYTGERGYELQITPPTKTFNLFMMILNAGEEFGIKPIGLGARDTLRLEKCFALAGNEFEGGRTPLEANLSFIINWDHDFIGKKALLKQKEKGEYERLTYLKCLERGVPRHGCPVKKEGKEVGKVSSGTLSPCLGVGIAMAYVKPGFRKVGDTLDIVIRNKKVKAEVVKPPFVGREC